MLRSARTRALISALQERILVMDGAMGTALQARKLTPSDFGGLMFEDCYENLIFTRPDIVQDIHEEYLKAGCDIIETNTFGSTPYVLDKFGLGHLAEEQNRLSAQIAQKAAAQYSTPDQPRFVAGSIGPTSQVISIMEGLTFEALQENFYIQAKGLIEGGVDYLLFETCQDTRNIKAGILAAERLFAEKGERIPIAVSVTIEPKGTMLAGQSIEALLASLSHIDLLYLGLNCATGPEFMTDAVRTLARLSPFRVACVPNAGLPDENGCYLESPSMVASILARFLTHGWLNLMGGCCGTHTGHIQALVKLAHQNKPRIPLPPPRRSFLSGVDYLEITDKTKPILVGERCNVNSNPKFRDLIVAGEFEAAAEIARNQLRNGAQIIAICLVQPARDELKDMRSFIRIAVKKLRTPLLIDSNNPAVIELALTYCQGKAMIRSNGFTTSGDFEDWGEAIILLARKYGAALVIKITSKTTTKTAEKIYENLTKKHALPPEDIYWNPLIPAGSPAVEIIETLRLLKKRFPLTQTLFDTSTVSIEPTLLHRCVQAGLDLAIMNPELYNAQGTALLVHKTIGAHLPLIERLPRYIIEGLKEGLSEDLREALKTLRPLEIINGPLMKGMDEVGKLFSANQLIVAEVLQSAEVMKAAVAHLEPFMTKPEDKSAGSSETKGESAHRGTVLLATVQGDVHDIGKNLVEIILANNGFKIVNMGIKVPPQQLIQAIQEHQPDIVGLSGLLVKSAHQMVTTAKDFAEAGISTPLLVGGAALSSNFVDKQIAKAYTTGTVAYASDVMSGLNLAKIIVDPERFEEFKTALLKRRAEAVANEALRKPTPPSIKMPTDRSSLIPILSDVPTPADLERHVLKTTPIDQIWNYINPLMLYGRHLGIRGASVRLLEKAVNSTQARKELADKDPKAVKIWDAVQEVKNEYRDTEIMQPRAIYQFFRASSEGNSLHLYSHAPLAPTLPAPSITFDFPRQKKPKGLCLADYTRPLGEPSSPGLRDTVGVFIVTVGKGVRPMAEYLKNKGDYLKSHIVQALALESAEAYSEMIHSQIRKTWGFPDTPETTLMDRFQAKYRGKRYSFGYPACPNLEDQGLLWKLLQPQDIGVQLTDGFMMDPEATVSAIVFHHPAASYFSVGPTSLEGTSNEDNRQ